MTEAAFAIEKQGDSVPPWTRLRNRVPSSSILRTPFPLLLSSAIRFTGIAISGSVCRKRQQRDPAQHRREPPSREVSFRQHQPVVPRMLNQSPAGLHQSLVQAGQRPVFDPGW
jgi:hypothetical protein